MTLTVEHALIIYSMYMMYIAGEVSVHRACCKRATQPLEGEVRLVQAQA